MPVAPSHAHLAEDLRARVMSSGVLREDVRARTVALGAGDAHDPAGPVETLAAQVGQASYRVTDEQVAAVRDTVGSDKAAFEVLMAASIGAGLRRWMPRCA